MQTRSRLRWRLALVAAALLGANPASSPAQIAGAAAEKFAVADYLADVDELQKRLLDQSSYLERRNFDHERVFAALRQLINEQMDLTRFVYDIQKLIMQIGDCHAEVRLPKDPPASKSLPFRPADTAAGVAALNAMSNQLLDNECPYLESIDGVSLDRWMEAAAKYVAQASPQLVRRRSLEWMGDVDLMRSELSLPPEEIVQIGLRSANGAKHANKRLRVSGLPYYIATVRLRPSRVLDGNIGYLRIRSMDDRMVEAVVREVKAFKDTKGLVIDVRDNPGGTYGIMRGIYGFFVPDDAKPKVTNIAAYRLSPTFARNHIEYRPTFRADWPDWSGQEQQAIREVAEKFRPEWILPPGKFSEWHYMLLSRTRSGRGGPSQQTVGGISDDYFYYDKPVVVLSNAGSFSAADGFVNAFGDLPQVTVVGEPSAGGSGATRTFRLPKTGVGVALASMASFRPNGKLFDGNGIEVDITLRPTLEDFTNDADSVLARAVEVVQEKVR